MSSFVQQFGSSGDGEPPEEHAQPVWLGPPDDELGVATPLAVVVGRSGQAAVALTRAMSFTTGLTLSFLAQARGLDRRAAHALFHEQHPWAAREEELSDGFLRLGVELPGGAKASNIGGRPPWGKDDPEGPVFIHRGGGGGEGRRDCVTMNHDYWIGRYSSRGRSVFLASGRWSGSPSRRSRSTAVCSSRRRNGSCRCGPLDLSPAGA